MIASFLKHFGDLDRKMQHWRHPLPSVVLTVSTSLSEKKRDFPGQTAKADIVLPPS